MCCCGVNLNSKSFKQSPILPIKIPKTHIDNNKLKRWYNSTDLEIAKGMNPHYKIFSGDSENIVSVFLSR